MVLRETPSSKEINRRQKIKVGIEKITEREKEKEIEKIIGAGLLAKTDVKKLVEIKEMLDKVDARKIIEIRRKLRNELIAHECEALRLKLKRRKERRLKEGKEKIRRLDSPSGKREAP